MDVDGRGDERISGPDAPLLTGRMLGLRGVGPPGIIAALVCLVVGGLATYGSVGARAGLAGQGHASAAMPEPAPALIDVLHAAEALHNAGLLPGQGTVPRSVEPTPALIDILRAADALQKAGLLPGRAGASLLPEPTPTLIDILRSADALKKAGLLPGRAGASLPPEPTPTLIDILRSADALKKAGLLPGQASGSPPPAPTLIDVLRAAAALKQVGLLPSPTAAGLAPEQPVSEQQRARPDVVFFGDSVTVGAGASDPDKGFASILRQRLSAESRMGASQVIVSAFGGWHGDLENVRAVLRERPGVVVVEVGAHSAVEDQATPIATFRSVYGLMLDCLQGTGAIVVVGTTPWLHWPRNGPAYARAAAVSEVIGEEAAKRGIPVADIWSAMKDRESYVSSDDFHPNDRGHELIADLYWKRIQAQASTAPRAPASACSA